MKVGINLKLKIVKSSAAEKQRDLSPSTRLSRLLKEAKELFDGLELFIPGYTRQPVAFSRGDREGCINFAAQKISRLNPKLSAMLLEGIKHHGRLTPAIIPYESLIRALRPAQKEGAKEMVKLPDHSVRLIAEQNGKSDKEARDLFLSIVGPNYKDDFRKMGIETEQSFSKAEELCSLSVAEAARELEVTAPEKAADYLGAVCAFFSADLAIEIAKAINLESLVKIILASIGTDNLLEVLPEMKNKLLARILEALPPSSQKAFLITEDAASESLAFTPEKTAGIFENLEDKKAASLLQSLDTDLSLLILLLISPQKAWNIKKELRNSHSKIHLQGAIAWQEIPDRLIEKLLNSDYASDLIDLLMKNHGENISFHNIIESLSSSRLAVLLGNKYDLLNLQETISLPDQIGADKEKTKSAFQAFSARLLKNVSPAKIASMIISEKLDYPFAAMILEALLTTAAREVLLKIDADKHELAILVLGALCSCSPQKAAGITA